MEIGQAIAQNLKRLRSERNLSLGQLAEASGVSKMMLSQVERGDANPTINTLWKIAAGLHVPYSALMDAPAPDVTVVRAADVEPHADHGGAYRLGCLFPSTPARDFELFVDELDAGAAHETGGHVAPSNEYLVVISGRLEMTVGEEAFELEPGDAICFDALQPHAYRTLGNETCRMVCVNHYPG